LLACWKGEGITTFSHLSNLHQGHWSSGQKSFAAFFTGDPFDIGKLPPLSLTNYKMSFLSCAGLGPGGLPQKAFFSRELRLTYPKRNSPPLSSGDFGKVQSTPVLETPPFSAFLVPPQGLWGGGRALGRSRAWSVANWLDTGASPPQPPPKKGLRVLPWASGFFFFERFLLTKPPLLFNVFGPDTVPKTPLWFFPGFRFLASSNFFPPVSLVWTLCLPPLLFVSLFSCLTGCPCLP